MRPLASLCNYFGILFFFYCGASFAQVTISVPSSSTTGNYSVSINNAYQWYLYEKGASETNWRQIGAGGTSKNKFDVVGQETGYYQYRVYNCYPTANPCAYSNVVGISVDIPYPELDPPSLSVPSTDTDGSFSVTWSSVQYAETYRLWEQFNGGNWVYIGETSTTSKSRSGKADGIWAYKAKSCANDSYDCSENYSATKSVKVARVPGSPPSVSAPSLTDGEFDVTWAASSGNVASYVLEQQKNSGSWGELATLTGLKRTISGLSEGTYRYRVKACNNVAGYKPCSGYAYSGYVSVAKPNTPVIGSFSTTNNTGSYTVSWSSVTNLDYFVLEEAIGSAGYNPISFTSNTSFTLTGKTRNTYSYRVTACNQAGCSGRSSARSVSVVFTPGVPSNITTPEQNFGSFTVSWGTASGSPTSYELYRSKDSGGWGLVYSGSGTSANFTSIPAGLYQHKVVACAQAGSYKLCSNARESGATIVIGASEILTNTYSYDALGRLVGVSEYGYLKTRYCYDPVGNRTIVTDQISAGDCPEPPIPDSPENLQVSTYSGAYVATWNTVGAATFYIVKHTTPQGSEISEIGPSNAPRFEYGFNPVDTGRFNPIYVQACNSYGCSSRVYF
ncbi:RHS repeat domain-containing protein [Teredinibacter turnerae]|uniref:RHS repeat domain-containing protein n=1 Tax=Teredinibacter turnerae TaxID=2426 RepID=UPI000400CB7D|nr:RHS repeat domain-containing protein [Teredinibacter turnerae]